jgi:elongation factor P--(R)-beta-lysine ligase
MALEESSRLQSKKIKLEFRAKIIDGIRAFFVRENFLEIETPLRVPAIAPEQFIHPYTSEGWFLSTSPELQMKRLLSAGYERIFQICHCFRRDECGRHHNPEFTMLEWYRYGADYSQFLMDTENLILSLARQFYSSPLLTYQDKKIDLHLPWPRVSVKHAYTEWAGWNPFTDFDGQRFDDDMVNIIIPHFPADRPIVLTDYPRECAALARLKTGILDTAERAEVFIAGLEIANGYSELTDPAEQEKRFKSEIAEMLKTGIPAVWPEKYMEAIRSLPVCAGIALGVDRLVMLLTNSADIDEVIAFPADKL